MGGRGAGKTRTGAETLADWIFDQPGIVDGARVEWAIVAPTYGDARSVCAEGGSGILRALKGAVEWNKSVGEIHVKNGAIIYLDGADDGAYRIQGKNLSGVWADEVGLWAHGWDAAWNESIQFALRKAPGQIVATGTPKAGHKLIAQLLADPLTVVSRMRTLDNAANLDRRSLEALVLTYKGKRLGRQELDAEWLEDVEGALWNRAQLEALRVPAEPVEVMAAKMLRVVVGVDPQGSSSEAANAGGVIVVGLGRDNHCYVLDDLTTTSGGPRAWAKAAVGGFHKWKADKIVAEKNYGGEMVAVTIHTVDDRVPVKLVTASRGKRPRAEPVASLYEGDESNPPTVHHAGAFPELEDEMVSWTPDADSPNRMDALVWAISELKPWREPRPMRSFVPQGRIPGALERIATEDLLGTSY